MKKLFHFKSIRMKILFGFALVILLVVAYAASNLWLNNKSIQNIEELVYRQVQLLIANEQMANSMSSRVASVRSYVLFGNDSYKDLFDQYAEQGKKYDKIAKDLNSSKKF